MARQQLQPKVIHIGLPTDAADSLVEFAIKLADHQSCQGCGASLKLPTGTIYWQLDTTEKEAGVSWKQTDASGVTCIQEMMTRERLI